MVAKKRHLTNPSDEGLMQGEEFATGYVLCVSLSPLFVKKEKVNFKNQFLVHLSTVVVLKYSDRSWVTIQSARWVTIQSASTIKPHPELYPYVKVPA